MTSAPAQITSPAERTLRAHIASGRFQLAVNAGHWKVEHSDFPVLDVRVFASNGDLSLRLELTDYPGRPPAGCPWDIERGVPLEPEYWPTGARATAVFRRDWSPQHAGALYLALDRGALEAHPDWSTTYAGRAWNNTKTIFDYLLFVHGALRTSSIPERPTP